MASNSFEVVRVEPTTHGDDILSVLKRDLPAAGSRKRFEWLYKSNPDGRALAWVAYSSSGRPVGTSAAIPRKIRVGEAVLNCLVLSDFAVDPAFRSLGPALRLLRATLAPVREGNFEFSYDFPSQSMYAIYRRMGAQCVGNEHRFVRLLSSVAITRRHLGDGLLSAMSSRFIDAAIRLREVPDRLRRGIIVENFAGDFDNDFWELSKRVCGTRKISLDRNPLYLNWRFRQHPEREHTVLVARRGRDLVGYAILRLIDARVLGIDEFVCLPDNDIRRALVSAAFDFGRKIGVERLQCTVLESAPVEEVLLKSGFSFRAPSVGPVVFAREQCEFTKLISDKCSWWLGDGDKDG